jgi:hypothetical protein
MGLCGAPRANITFLQHPMASVRCSVVLWTAAKPCVRSRFPAVARHANRTNVGVSRQLTVAAHSQGEKHHHHPTEQEIRALIKDVNPASSAISVENKNEIKVN